MKKRVLIAAVAAALSVSSAAPALAAGWQRDDKGWWYALDNGGYVANSWKTIGDRDYYFDASGYLVKGWMQLGSQWRYFREDGNVAVGWQMDNGKWYYFDEKGNMQTGFVELKNKMYYLNEDGSMAVGQKEIDGQIWFFESDGAAKSGGSSFIQNGVKYRYRDNILERYNVVYSSWEPVPGVEEAMDMIKEKLREDYVEYRIYSSELAFERDARMKLGKYLTDDELYWFIQNTEREYESLYGYYSY